MFGATAIQEYLFNAIFIFDMYITLRTAFYGDNGKLVSNRWSILSNYAHGWMVLDIVTLVPFEFLLATVLNL